jgi:hypothetical protein
VELYRRIVLAKQVNELISRFRQKLLKLILGML